MLGSALSSIDSFSMVEHVGGSHAQRSAETSGSGEAECRTKDDTHKSSTVIQVTLYDGKVHHKPENPIMHRHIGLYDLCMVAEPRLWNASIHSAGARAMTTADLV